MVWEWRINDSEIEQLICDYCGCRIWFNHRMLVNMQTGETLCEDCGKDEVSG